MLPLKPRMQQTGKRANHGALQVLVVACSNNRRLARHGEQYCGLIHLSTVQPKFTAWASSPVESLLGVFVDSRLSLQALLKASDWHGHLFIDGVR